jgi:hypothetical protein
MAKIASNWVRNSYVRVSNLDTSLFSRKMPMFMGTSWVFLLTHPQKKMDFNTCTKAVESNG